MAYIAIVMELFIYNEAKVSIEWPLWIYKLENFLVLRTIDITIVAGAANALRHLLHFGNMKIM